MRCGESPCPDITYLRGTDSPRDGDYLRRSNGKKGTTPYVTHFVFRPLQTINIEGVGSVTLLEATGTTDNLKGEKMLDKMSARCEALSVDSGPKKYIDGACVLADADGDKIFSTFDTRDVDKSQPDMACGTHVITGGTGFSACPALRVIRALRVIVI